MNNAFLELIHIAIGKRDSFSHKLTESEWAQVYKLAVKHSLVGVMFGGIERLPKEQTPPLDLLMNWLGQSEYIKGQNKVISKRASELYSILSADARRSLVLKGQGVALLYPKPRLRAPGDIDLWIEGTRDEILGYLKSKGWKVGKVVVHHADVEIFPDVSTEIHFIPSYSYSPIRYGKYKKWFADQGVTQFGMYDGEAGFAYPSSSFNAVYSLLHIFRHVFHEGIGLRQLMDYYFILMDLSSEERIEAANTLRWMGLAGFTSSVMYVLREVFNIDEEKYLFSPDEKSGQFLLREILNSGNFGKYNEEIRDAHKGGSLRLYMMNVKRLFRMIHYYPSEVLWAPIWKPVHFLWRCFKGYRKI